MVSYGPWVQDPDYLQWRLINELSGTDPFTGIPYFAYDMTIAEQESGFIEPAYIITEGDLKEVTDAVYEGVPAEEPVAWNLWGTFYSWTYSLSFPQWNSQWAASISRRTFQIIPREYFYVPSNHVPIPEGAIGVEFEGQPFNPETPWQGMEADVVSLHIGQDSVLRGYWADTSEWPPTERVPSASTDIWLTIPAVDKLVIESVDGSTVYNSGGNPSSRTLDEAIDLTPYLADHGWRGWIHTEAVPRKAAHGGNVGAVGSDATLQYGWGFHTLRLNTMVRPRVYRWVFPGDFDPYRRVYPRDDARAGGAPRTFPQSRAEQASNRIGGAYL